MAFLELARKRCSIRAYRAEPVGAALLRDVLEAGRLAPSAYNRQPWVFIVLQDEERRRRLRAAYAREWFWTAPVVIAICCDRRAAWMRPRDGKAHGDIDVAIAVDHMTLCAADLGLGTCWVCAFDPAEARRLLEVPEHVEPVAFLSLGIPAEPGRTKERKALDDVVRWESWAGRTAPPDRA